MEFGYAKFLIIIVHKYHESTIIKHVWICVVYELWSLKGKEQICPSNIWVAVEQVSDQASKISAILHWIPPLAA